MQRNGLFCISTIHYKTRMAGVSTEVFHSLEAELQTDPRLEEGLLMTVMTAMMETMAVISNRYQTNHLGNYQEHLVRLVRHRVLLRTGLQLLCVRHYRI